jgi:hypothetical protein
LVLGKIIREVNQAEAQGPHVTGSKHDRV